MGTLVEPHSLLPLWMKWEMSGYEASFLLLALLLAMVAFSLLGRREKEKGCPGPRQWPILGSALEMMTTFDRQYDWLTDYAHRFSTFHLRFLSIRVVYTTEPANVEHILKTRFSSYAKGEIAYEVQGDLLGDGIFNADGEKWRQQRKVASLEFSSKFLREYSCQAFQKYSRRLCGILALAVESKQIVDIYELLMRLTFDSICEVNFGVEMGTLSPSLPEVPFAKAFDRCNSCCAQRYWDPLWKIKRLLNIGNEAQLKKDIALLDKFTYGIIESRKKDIKDAPQNMIKGDLLSRFLSLSKDDPETFTDKMLRDAVLNFVIAGRDSTAATLSWFFFLLSTSPDVEEKIVEEINLVIDRNTTKSMEESSRDDEEEEEAKKQLGELESFTESLNFEMLNKLHYLHASLTETLRLYPAVPVDGKMAITDDVLPDGTHIYKGDVVNYVPYAMGRLERLWGEDVLQFKPERWMKNGVFQPESPFKFTAFQAGPRICLGKDSAYLQMKTIAATLLRFFKLTIVPGHVPNYRMALLLLMSSKGLKMTLQWRD